MYGFKRKGDLELPQWSHTLKNHYVSIRVDGRNATVKRRHYRAVEKEKLRLAELGICQQQILACCRYLSAFTKQSEARLKDAIEYDSKQLKLPF
jgi:hypothetical protein